MTRELTVDLVAPSGETRLVTIDMDNVDEHAIFTGIRDTIANDIGRTPPVMSYFRAEGPDGKRYDLAMLFTSEYIDVATAAQLQGDYQLVTQALVKLVGVLNEGGFK